MSARPEQMTEARTRRHQPDIQASRMEATAIGQASAARVLHITTCVGGGVPQVIVDHAAAVPELEHYVLWPPENDHLDDRDLVIKSPMPSPIHRRRSAISSAVSAVDPQLVIAHSTAAGLLTRMGRKGPVPLIYQPHGYAFEAPHRPAWQRRGIWAVESLLGRRPDAVIAITPRELALASSLGARRAFVVHNCSHAYSEARQSPSGFTVVMSGRIARQKDPAFFADVARAVTQRLPEARFRWVGDGEASLRPLLESAGVEVTGWLTPKESWRELSQATIYAHTAAYEGFPLSVVDAATLGLPLALRQIAAFDEYGECDLNTVDEMAGFLVACADSESPELLAAGRVRDRVAADSSIVAQRRDLLAMYSWFVKPGWR